MAEIRVEPKRKAPIWPWIIGILILLGLIWLLVEAFEQDSPEDQIEDTLEEGEDAVEDTADEVGSLPDKSQHTLVLHIYAAPDSHQLSA